MTFFSGALNAGDDADKPAAQIAKPKLLSHGVEMTLATPEERSFSAGEEPAFELTAVNTTGEAATASVHIAMTASSPEDRMSRVMRLPSALWQQNQLVELQAHETKVLRIPVAAKLPANSMIAVSLQDSNPAPADSVSPASKPLQLRAGVAHTGIVALNFSTVAPVAQTVSTN
jgi:hypothetical protein